MKSGFGYSADERESFFLLAAGIFEVERAALSEDTRFGEVPGWDSVNHLRLIMETERLFGVSYPLEKIPSMRKLSDFLV